MQITGTDLGYADAVDFGAGNLVYAPFVTQSATLIQVDAPVPAAIGATVDLQVVTADGTSALNGRPTSSPTRAFRPSRA